MKVSNVIRDMFYRHGIQFRKKDVRRSENVTLGINNDCLRNQKKILVSYLDYDRSAYSLRHSNLHTNVQEMMQIIKVLIDLDFSIDVCGCNNKDASREIAADYYDYILGFGDMFRIAIELNPKAYSIIYMTENPYGVSRKQEQERVDYFCERTGKRIRLERTGKFYHESDEKMANAVICLGEKMYFDNQIIHRVYPTAFKNSRYNDNLSHNRTPVNFMVFGVKGFVHKGNDLLIEVFARHQEWSLYMCGTGINEECGKLGIKLPHNVIDCGFVDYESEAYLELVGKCPFVLLPSCSEGMSTALLTCMRHGMIPVTIRGTGMDELEEYCEFFDGYHLDNIEEKILELSKWGNAEIEHRSNCIYDYANKTFTVERYTDNIRNILENILCYGGRV